MGHNQIAAFARLANGNVTPTRNIFGQHTLITRSIHSFKWDPIKDEIVVPQFQAQAILTFRGGANGDEAPIRVLQGPDVKIPNLDLVSIDPVHREIFVGARDTGMMVYPLDANGNAAPLRVLKGPDTQLPKVTNAMNIAVDPIHDLLFIGSGGKILIFNRTDSGNTKPLGVISAPK